MAIAVQVQSRACVSLSSIDKLSASTRMPDPDEPVYRTEAEKDRFAVKDDANRVIVVCRDKGSADQYAALLNEAFRKGFKAGCRQARAQ